jgi:hypothetical protein
MSEPATAPAPSRREFNAALALLAVAHGGLSSAARLVADEKPPDLLTVAAEALSAATKARYGKYLTAEQLAEVEKSIRGGVFRAELMRKVALTNADEPAFAFSADV